MGGYRYRWMYYLTGLPGWMRFGFSPGWLGRSPTGLGPCAEYLLTGRSDGRRLGGRGGISWRLANGARLLRRTCPRRNDA